MIPHSVCLLYQRKMPQTVCDWGGGGIYDTAFWLPNRYAFQDSCIVLPQNSSVGKIYCWSNVFCEGWTRYNGCGAKWYRWYKKKFVKFKSIVWEFFSKLMELWRKMYLIFSSLARKCITPNFWGVFFVCLFYRWILVLVIALTRDTKRYFNIAYQVTEAWLVFFL